MADPAALFEPLPNSAEFTTRLKPAAGVLDIPDASPTLDRYLRDDGSYAVPAGTGAGMLIATKLLTQTDIVTLNGGGSVEIIADPGGGKVVYCLGYTLSYENGPDPYSNDTYTVKFNYDPDGVTIFTTVTIDMTGGPVFSAELGGAWTSEVVGGMSSKSVVIQSADTNTPGTTSGTLLATLTYYVITVSP